MRKTNLWQYIIGFVVGLIVYVLFSLAVHAQTPPRVTWDQPAAGLVEASSFTYKSYIDSSPGTVLGNVSCAGLTSPFQCQAPFTGFPTTGSHMLRVSATDAVLGLESALSPAAPFGPPGSPTNLRIVK